MLAFITSKDMEDFKEFFGTRDDIMNSIVALTCLVLVLVLPIWVYRKVMEHFGDLDSKAVKGKYGVFLEGLKLRDPHAAAYNVYFMARRLAICTVLVFMY
jgi:hypothetical protein